MRAPRGAALDVLVATLIGPVLLVAGAWFLWGPVPSDMPTTDRIAVPPEAFTSDPIRTRMVDPPTLDVAGFAKKCSECHALFRSTPETPIRLNQHRNLVQAHGMNDRCFNCHDRDDRDLLVLPGGRTIAFADAPRLCATCHGPTYRDWEVGMHGRTAGSWNTQTGRQVRLGCTQCHDPHAPAFAPMSALPGPNTLRMGAPRLVPHGPPKQHNPLRRWSSAPGAHEEHH